MNYFKKSLHSGLILFSLTALKAMENPYQLKNESTNMNVRQENTSGVSLSTYFWKAAQIGKENLSVHLTLSLPTSRHYFLVPSIYGKFEEQLEDVIRRRDSLVDQFNTYKNFIVIGKVHIAHSKYKKYTELKLKEKNLAHYPVITKTMNEDCKVALHILVKPIDKKRKAAL